MSTRELTTWHLASMAECGTPEACDGYGFDPALETSPVPSAGASFLRNVADEYDEAAEWAADNAGDPIDSDRIHELADSSVPIYTHELWAVFVDLAGYSEDVAELVDSIDFDTLARTALCIIAERLLQAIHAERVAE